MQAVRAESKRQLDARWLQHLSLLSAVGFLLSWAVATRPQAAGQLVDSLNVRFLAPPSTPAQEWLPVRVPVRTAIPRDPSPPNTVGLAAAESGGFQWVQAHRGTFLLADPEPGAAREIEVPQWSYLRGRRRGSTAERCLGCRDRHWRLGRPAALCHQHPPDSALE